MRSTLESSVYRRPLMVSEPASRGSAKRGSVTTNWRTFRAAMAVETPTTPRARSQSQRRHRKPAGFWVERAMSVHTPEFVEQLFAGLPDVAGAQSEDGVAFLRHGSKRLDAAIDGAGVFDGAVAELADAIDQGLGGDAFDGLFGGRIDIHHENRVGLVKGARELVHQMERAGEAMGLEEDVDAPETAHAGAIQGRADFGGMVAVIVDDGDAALDAAHLKAAVDAVEGGKGFADFVGGDFEFHGDGDGGHGVEHVVAARNAQVEAAQVGGAIAQAEIAGKGVEGQFRGFHVGLRGGSIGDDAALDGGQNALHVGVVQAHDHGAVKRHLVDEFDKGGAGGFDGRIVVHVFAIDVGDHRQDGGELQEGAVAFVGFGHQEIAAAHARVGAAHGTNTATDHYRGIQARVIENGGGHGSGGGLTVAAGHGDAVLQAHQLGQHFAARDDRDLQAARLLHFGVGFVHGGADHQRTRTGDVRRSVAFEDARAHGFEALGGRRKLKVGTADLVSEVEQHFGYAAHSDSADPREMEVLGTKKHFLNVLFRLAGLVSIENCGFQAWATSSKMSAARCAEPGWANPRARAAMPSSTPGAPYSSETAANSLSPFMSASRTRRAAPPRSMASALRVW